MTTLDWCVWASIALSQWIVFPVCREMWTRWKRTREQEQHERLKKQWREEDKILDEQERRELYRQATRHADHQEE